MCNPLDPFLYGIGPFNWAVDPCKEPEYNPHCQCNDIDPNDLCKNQVRYYVYRYDRKSYLRYCEAAAERLLRITDPSSEYHCTGAAALFGPLMEFKQFKKNR